MKRVSVLTGAALLMFGGCGKFQSKSQKQSELENQISQTVFSYVSQINTVYSLYQEGMASCRQYLDGSIEDDAWNEMMKNTLNELEQIEKIPISQTLLDDYQESDFSVTEIKVLPDYISVTRDNCMDDLDFLSQFISLNQDVPLYGKLALDNYEGRHQEEILTFWYATNEVMLTASDDVLNTFFENTKELSCFKEIDLATSKEDAVRLQDVHYQQQKQWRSDLSKLTALMQSEVNAQYEDMVQQLIDLHMDPDEAESLVAQISHISSKELLLEDSKQELEEAKQKLEEAKQEMWEKFAPQEDDEPGILWGKARRFAKVKMYEEAAKCMEVLEKLNDSERTPECCRIGAIFYRNAPQLGYTYGIMVVKEPPADSSFSLGPYQVGDVLVSVNDKPVYDTDTFDSLKEERQDGYQAQVLRISSDGILELKDLTVPSGVACYWADLTERKEE